MAFGAFQTAAPAGGQAAFTQVQKKSPVALWLLLPGILYLILFFVTPLFSLVITSFQAPIPGCFFETEVPRITRISVEGASAGSVCASAEVMI